MRRLTGRMVVLGLSAGLLAGCAAPSPPMNDSSAHPVVPGDEAQAGAMAGKGLMQGMMAAMMSKMQPPKDLVTEAHVTSVEASASLDRQGSCQYEQIIAVGRSMAPYLFSGEALDGTFGNCVSLDSERMVIYDNGGDAFAIKWLLGLPGDVVGLTDAGQVTINGKKLVSIENEPYVLSGRRLAGMDRILGTIPADRYLVLGNLKSNTLDSSIHGLVTGDAIRGTAKKTISMDNPVAWVDMEAVEALVPSHVPENEVLAWIGETAYAMGFTQVVDKRTEGVFPAVDITESLVSTLKQERAEATVVMPSVGAKGEPQDRKDAAL